MVHNIETQKVKVLRANPKNAKFRSLGFRELRVEDLGFRSFRV